MNAEESHITSRSQIGERYARDALLAMGVPASQILFAQGWGKLYPVCGQSDEACWQQNRRVHISPW
jgi:outer membrane protein OmpA-like peptidoglycan-associated protein